MRASNVSASKYLRIEVLLFGGLILASGLIAIGEFRTTVRFSDLLYINSSLTEEDSYNPTIVERFATEAEDIVSGNECRSDIIQAGLSFVMRDLDLQDSINRYDQWAVAMDRANRYVLHGLSCNPADGDMWARLALVSQSVGENPQQLSDIMAQSVLLSPSEIHTLRARFVVWKKATPATLAASQKSVERDLRTLLNYSNPGDLADILGTQNADLQTYSLIAEGSELNPYVVAATALLPQARKDYLDARGIKLPVQP